MRPHSCWSALPCHSEIAIATETVPLLPRSLYRYFEPFVSQWNTQTQTRAVFITVAASLHHNPLNFSVKNLQQLTKICDCILCLPSLLTSHFRSKQQLFSTRRWCNSPQHFSPCSGWCGFESCLEQSTKHRYFLLALFGEYHYKNPTRIIGVFDN